MGLRSFIALPINKNGVVTRFVVDEVPDTNNGQLTANIAYGIDSTQTFFLAAPYRLSSGEGDHLGDIGLLYRNIIWQDIDSNKPTRLGLLAGTAIPTENNRDPKASVGFVVTHFNDRHDLMLMHFGNKVSMTHPIRCAMTYHGNIEFIPNNIQNGGCLHY